MVELLVLERPENASGATAKEQRAVFQEDRVEHLQNGKHAGETPKRLLARGGRRDVVSRNRKRKGAFLGDGKEESL